MSGLRRFDGGCIARARSSSTCLASLDLLTLACILYSLSKDDSQTHITGETMLELILVYFSFTAVLVVYGAQV